MWELRETKGNRVASIVQLVCSSY